MFRLLLLCVLCHVGMSDHQIKKVPEKCILGKYHKERPSPEGPEFKECLSWKKLSCCNVNISREIQHFRAKNLYDFHYHDKCGEISEACENFIKDEECFYQCEPMLGYYQIEQTGYIRDVPICAKYCDAWYDACKTEKTCWKNWLDDAISGENKCPDGAECITFEEMYGSGKELCNTMWGDAFAYDATNEHCMVMKFDMDGENPNIEMKPYASGSTAILADAVGVIALLLGVSLLW